MATIKRRPIPGFTAEGSLTQAAGNYRGANWRAYGSGVAPSISCEEECDGDYRCIAGSCYRYVCNHDTGKCDWLPAVGCSGC